VPVETVNPSQITEFDANGSSFDEGFVNVLIGFNVLILGRIYNRVYINSNSYFTFGGIVSEYGYESYEEWASGVPYPGVFVGSSDGGLQLIKSTGPLGTIGQRTNTIRFQGSANYSTSDPNLSDVIWEITFREDQPSKILLKIIAFNDEGGEEGVDFFTFSSGATERNPTGSIVPFVCETGAQYEITLDLARQITVEPV
jgi:hypothetical protein